MATISLWLRSPSGLLLVPGVPTSEGDWGLEENTFHVLRASGPLDEIDKSYFVLDARFELHRSIDGRPGYIEGNTQFMLRWWRFYNEGGKRLWEIEAYSPEYHILTGRDVDYDASTPEVTNAYTTKSGPADNVVKAIARENGGALTANSSPINAELAVDPDLSLAPSISKSFAKRELLSVLQEIAADSAALGTWLSFGMVASGAGTGFTFKTWTGHRGQDHTAGTGDEVIVSEALGNLVDPSSEEDHRTEVTAVRAGGLGLGAERSTARAEDTARSNASPWAYREKFHSHPTTDDPALLNAEARAELNACRPVKGFSGTVLDTDYARYGERFNFGDLVTGQHEGQSYTCRVSAVKGHWDKSGETLTIGLNDQLSMGGVSGWRSRDGGRDKRAQAGEGRDGRAGRSKGQADDSRNGRAGRDKRQARPDNQRVAAFIRHLKRQVEKAATVERPRLSDSGWIHDAATWTYASATTFTRTGASSDLFPKGAKIRYKQGGGWKYGYVLGVSGTTVTITGGSDYALTNAAITDTYTSFMDQAPGHPVWFNWAPTFSGFSVNPTGTHRFMIRGHWCQVNVFENDGTSNANSFTMSSPVPVAVTGRQPLAQVYDNGAAVNGASMVNMSASTFTLYKDPLGTAWTASGTKLVRSMWGYEI